MKWTWELPSVAVRLVQRRQVALESAVRADDQQPRPRVEKRVIRMEEADEVLDLLVRRSRGRRTGRWSTSSSNMIGDQPVRRDRRGARNPARPAARPSGGNPSASRSCRLNSESPSARSQRSAYARSSRRPRKHCRASDRWTPTKILRRRDVVVDERHPVRQRERRPRRLRAEREMVEQQVVGMADVDELPVVARQRLEPRSAVSTKISDS